MKAQLLHKVGSCGIEFTRFQGKRKISENILKFFFSWINGKTGRGKAVRKFSIERQNVCMKKVCVMSKFYVCSNLSTTDKLNRRDSNHLILNYEIEFVLKVF